MFADDTVLLIRDKNLKKLEKIIVTELLRITGWTRFNKLLLNFTKTYNMIRIIPNCKLKYKAKNFKISICSGGYSNSGARGKDFQKLMFSKKEK